MPSCNTAASTPPKGEKQDAAAHLSRRSQPFDAPSLPHSRSLKGKVVHQAIRNVGARLFFLPKYSPDLNPIEQVFSKLKHRLRQAGARTPDDICAAIGQILNTYTPQECQNYFINARYEQT